MSKQSITSFEACRCLTELQIANGPITAAQLAYKMNITGNRESQRRHIRAIIKDLRDNGSMIVATLQGGYFLTGDDAMWRDYLEGRQIDAKRILGETHKRKKMLTDAVGQGVLFGPMVTCGIG